MRKEESSGEKIILGRVLILHSVEVLGEIVLSVEGVHSWEVINLLMTHHLGQKLSVDGIIIPFYIPVFVFIILQFPPHFVADSFHNIVMGI